MQRVLILANRLPYPLDDGWKVRTFHIVRALARAAEVTLLLATPPDPAVAEAAARALGPTVRIRSAQPPRGHALRRLALGALTGEPLHVWAQDTPELWRAFREESRGIDAVLSVATFFWRYLRTLDARVLRLVDTHNIDSLNVERHATYDPSVPRRLYARMTVPKLVRLEDTVFAAADLVCVCSPEEEAIVRRRVPGAAVRVIPNGVDTRYFEPRPDVVPDPTRLVFFGKLDYFPNVDGLTWFVDDVLPRIQQRRPDVTVRVLGAGDARDVARVAARNPAVQLVGRVDDLRPELAAAAAVVVPLRVGAGTRLKIVEALSAGCPIVSTGIGAEGLGLTSGRELVLADTPEAFADASAALLADPARARALAAAGRRTVVERYDWEMIGEGFVREVHAAADARRHRRDGRAS